MTQANQTQSGVLTGVLTGVLISVFAKTAGPNWRPISTLYKYL
jgi:hypothetical protein